MLPRHNPETGGWRHRSRVPPRASPARKSSQIADPAGPAVTAARL